MSASCAEFTFESGSDLKSYLLKHTIRFVWLTAIHPSLLFWWTWWSSDVHAWCVCTFFFRGMKACLKCVSNQMAGGSTVKVSLQSDAMPCMCADWLWMCLQSDARRKHTLLACVLIGCPACMWADWVPMWTVGFEPRTMRPVPITRKCEAEILQTKPKKVTTFSSISSEN